MTLQASSFPVPGGATLLGAIDSSRWLLSAPDQLFVFDVAEAKFVARRTITGLTYARLCGPWVYVKTKTATTLVRASLDGDEVTAPDAELPIAGVCGSIALFATMAARLRFDLERREVLERSESDVSFNTVDEARGVFLGVRERTREVVALRAKDGAIAWEAKPFTRKVDNLGYPIVRGDEVHVRASARGEKLVARLSAIDGTVVGVSETPSLDSWLPDFGPDVAAMAMRYECRRSTFATDDAIVVPQDGQLVIVRAEGVSRLAVPHLTSQTYERGVLAGVLEDRERTVLVIVSLPASGEHDLELVPRGEDVAPAGDTAVVTFASAIAPVVAAQHAKYGRINLSRGPNTPPPTVGAQVMLDGVEVKPGNVVRVARWWIAGERTKRDVERFALGPPIMHAKRETDAPTSFAESLRTRAAEEGARVPDDVARFVELVDREPPLRKALASLGFHFAEDELGLEVLPELEITDFVPIWGNGYGDGFGGLTKDGALAYLRPKDHRTSKPLPKIVDYVRAQARDSDQEAAAELVIAALDRL